MGNKVRCFLYIISSCSLAKQDTKKGGPSYLWQAFITPPTEILDPLSPGLLVDPTLNGRFKPSTSVRPQFDRRWEIAKAD